MLERLKTLSELYGVSGNETRVRAYLRKQAEPYADDITVDPIGNLYVHKCGEGPRVMLAAHMDEVGMIVRDITESGTLLYDAGGIDPRVVVSKRVAIGPNDVPGVSGAKAIHLPVARRAQNACSSTPTCMWTSAQRTEPTLKSSWPRRLYQLYDKVPRTLGKGSCAARRSMTAWAAPSCWNCCAAATSATCGPCLRYRRSWACAAPR